MYDPLKTAFEFRLPWKGEYGDPFLTIWHVDPEVGEDDDSCDWWGGRLTPKEASQIEAHAKFEHQSFFGYDMIALKGADPLTVILAAWRSVKWELYRDQSLSHRELIKILALATTPGDNLRCYAERAEANPKDFEHLLMLLARQVKKTRRPWWKHPRYHVHHWQIQFHPWQRLRRYLFERCAYCGGRFVKGSPHVRVEELYHGRCLASQSKSTGTARPYQIE